MAGAGVSVGGAGMLRARRRDVSVKPNRKLDRKSSRGMIYENEELRLRTIHINAEVEQGQNDIKKLRRENEQLRREIWSLRDEYDKLEEILKSQKNSSEDYEDRSGDEDKDDGDEAEECSEYTSEENEEAEEDCDEEEKNVCTNGDTEKHEGSNQEERLENAENQKISSEKMNSGNHRLHVEFDDLSVVDEEEELKKDKERKEVLPSEERGTIKITKESDLARMQPRNGYQRFPPNCGKSGISGSPNPYYPDYPYAFPNSDGTEFTEILPIDPSSMLLTACPGLYDNSFPPISSFESPLLSNVPPSYDNNLRHDPTYGGSPIGWQSNIFAPNTAFQTSGSYQADVMANQASGMTPVSMFNQSGQSDHSSRTASTTRATNISRGTPIDDRTESSGRISSPVMRDAILPSLLQRRNMFQKQPNSFYHETMIPSHVGAAGIEIPSSAEVLTRNDWDFGVPGSSHHNVRIYRDTDDRKNRKEDGTERNEVEDIAMERNGLHGHEDSTLSACGSDRPKHFFAPLPAKIHHGHQDSGDKMRTRTTNNPSESPSTGSFETFGTGKSSSSERTNSTVISGRHFQPNGQTLTEIFSDIGEKGSADICVNGGVAANEQQDFRSNGERSYKSSENLLIGEKDNSRGNSSSRQGSNNPLVKSVSCQDLSSEPLQNALFEMTRTFQADVKSQKLTKSDNTLDNPASGSSKPFRSQLNVTLKFPCGSISSSSSKEHGRYSPETPEIPKLPTIDYRLFNNPFLKTFEPRGGAYGNYDIRGPVTRPLSIQVNENLSDRGKSYLQQCPSIDYSSPVLTQAFARRLNPEENTVKSRRAYGTSELESDRHRVALSSTTSQAPSVDPRIIANPKQRQEFQVTSFEQPNPCSLHQGLSAYDVDSLRRLPATTSTLNPLIANHRKLYQNVPFVPGTAGIFSSPGQNPVRMFYENSTQKVPAQTQTSIDGASNHEDEIDVGAVKNLKSPDVENLNTPGSPTSLRRKRTVRKERDNIKTNKRPLSPAAQRRRLRKQSSIDAADVPIEHNKSAHKTRKSSPAMTNTTTTTNSEHIEDKNESRSSSSGQDSPRKERNRRVSMYFNSKKRPSLGSVKTTRSASIDNAKDNFGTRGAAELLDTTNSERERTNSTSSREAATGKARKASVSSGKLPWCACWGNGCV